MNEHSETFSRFLHYPALYVNQILKCNYQPIDFYYLANPAWLECQDELQRRRLFRLLLRLRRRGAAPRCLQQHPLFSKASSATANTLPDFQHKDTGVCLSRAEQQMILKRPGASGCGKEGWTASERGCPAVTHTARALLRHWSPYQYFSVDQKHLGSAFARSISPCCNSHRGAAGESDSCWIQVGTRRALTTAPGCWFAWSRTEALHLPCPGVQTGSLWAPVLSHLDMISLPTWRQGCLGCSFRH